MRSIDLNADLGEGGSQDPSLMTLVSSVNIACGGHAGDEESMQTAIAAAASAGLSIGAHPGYEDRANFGRRPMDLQSSVIEDIVSRQVERFAELASKAGAVVHHVKPHGALYNQANQDHTLASAVAWGVKRIVPACRFYVPPEGALAAAGEAAGLIIRSEGFVDRRYQIDGSLVPRSQVGAVLESSDDAVAQALRIACEQRVSTNGNKWFSITAQTLCVHGDSPHAVELLTKVRHALETVGFTIRA